MYRLLFMTGLMIAHTAQTAVYDWSIDEIIHDVQNDVYEVGKSAFLIYHQVIFFIFIRPYFEHRFLFILYQEPSEEGVSCLAQTASGAASRGTA